MSGDIAVGAELLGKLRVIRKLGEGGIGAVWEVEHLLTHHRRAMKVLHPRLNADVDIVQRFLREASAAGRIGNPHIIEAFDAGRLDDGSPYLLMEYLEGEPLTDSLRRNGRLGVASTIELMLQVCDAIAAAHDAGVVHRDLKPDNLFVLARHGAPFIKVLDFGVSKFDSALTGGVSMTGTGVAIGTPLYMAPEQMRGAKTADQRADIYALGIIAYECLAGGTPYSGESFAEIASHALAGDAPQLHWLRPDLSPELCAAVMQAIRVKPEERFATARDFATALRVHLQLGHEPRWWLDEHEVAARSGARVALTRPDTDPEGIDNTALKPSGEQPAPKGGTLGESQPAQVVLHPTVATPNPPQPPPAPVAVVTPRGDAPPASVERAPAVVLPEASQVSPPRRALPVMLALTALLGAVLTFGYQAMHRDDGAGVKVPPTPVPMPMPTPLPPPVEEVDAGADDAGEGLDGGEVDAGSTDAGTKRRRRRDAGITCAPGSLCNDLEMDLGK